MKPDPDSLKEMYIEDCITKMDSNLEKAVNKEYDVGNEFISIENYQNQHKKSKDNKIYNSGKFYAFF